VGPYRTAAIPSEIELAPAEPEDDDSIFVPVVARSESRAVGREWSDRDAVKRMVMIVFVWAFVGIFVFLSLQR
jgi:hypothetical protein